MRQILYCSNSTLPGHAADLEGILLQSRHNNAINGVSGLLWSDGAKFLQVFEGPKASVALTWGRISSDHRHCDILVLQDKPTKVPEFGYWTMAYRRSADEADIFDKQVRRIVSLASPEVREPFLAMVATDDFNTRKTGDAERS